MTEEIIKECKNCDALGIDSEIGVYYCCLSHRQDDLPKEFICDDYTPNKQLKRLEQERDELKKTVENQKLEYEELQCDYNELEQRHNDAFKQFKEMKARHDELLASCEQSDQEAAEIINELKQKNKELGRKAFLAEQNTRTAAATFCEKDNKIKELEQENKQMKSALEEIREIAESRFVNGLNEEADLCNFAMDRIINKINEVLNEN